MWKALIKWVESWSEKCDHDWEFLLKSEKHIFSSKDPYRIQFIYRCTVCCESKKINT